jgi:hypothetical protein
MKIRVKPSPCRKYPPQAQKLFFTFFPPNSHVKPQNPATPYQTILSAWRISYTQPDIIEIGIKKEPRETGAVDVKEKKSE